MGNPNPSLLDQQGILQAAFDQAQERLRVDAEVTATIGEVSVIITDDEDSIKIGNGSGTYATITSDASKNRLDVSTGSEKYSGDPHTPTSKGTLALAVNEDGDYAPLKVNNSGELLIAETASSNQVLSLGTEDGELTGTQHVQKIDSDKRLQVRDELARLLLVAIESRLNTIESQTDNLESLVAATNNILNTTIADLLTDIKTNTEDVENLISNTNDILNLTIADILSDILTSVNSLPQNNDGLTLGTENGQVGGVQHVFVNNLRQMILAAKDRDQDIIYADFGTKNQRIIRIDYNAPSIGVGAGFTARKTLTYTPISGRYRRDKITWSLV